MPATRTLARLSICIGLAMFVADSITAQVVIRERVEVDAAQAGAVAAGVANMQTSGLIRGYYVYRPRVTSGFKSVGAPLAGTINITTTEGIFYSADVAPGFSSSGPSIFYNCENDPDSPYARWNYAPVAGVEILRVPVVADEYIAEGYTNTAGVDVDFSGSFGGANVGCLISVEPEVRCNCFANWAHEIVSIYFGINRTFEGTQPDTLDVSAQPNSLDLGQVATVTIIARDSLGSEVSLPDTEPITISISDATWGLLSYQGSTGSGLVVPYSDARGGAVSFVSDSTLSLPADTTVTISAIGGGVLGVGEVTIRSHACGEGAGLHDPSCPACEEEWTQCEPGSQQERQEFDPITQTGVFGYGETVTEHGGTPFAIQPSGTVLNGKQLGETTPITSMVGFDLLGDHVSIDVCEIDGERVYTVEGLYVPVLSDNTLNLNGREGVVDIDEDAGGLQTYDQFSDLIGQTQPDGTKLIMKEDYEQLRLAMEYFKVGPYAFRFHDLQLDPNNPLALPDLSNQALWSLIDEHLFNKIVNIYGIYRNYGDDYRFRHSNLAKDLLDNDVIVNGFLRYVSSEGLMIHEGHHVEVLRGDGDGDDSALADAIDESFNEIHKSAEERGHECPEDAIAFIEEQLRWALSSPGDVDGDGDDEDSYLVEMGFQGLNMNDPDTITLTSFENELDADREARNHYDDILDRLKAFKEEAERLGVWVE